MSMPQLAQVSDRTEDPHPGALQCQFPRCSLAFYVSTNNPFVDAPIWHSVNSDLRIALLSHPRSLPLLFPFSLSLLPLPFPLLLPPLPFLACHGVNVHWCWSRMIWSPLPAHCQKRLNGCTHCRTPRQGLASDQQMRSDC